MRGENISHGGGDCFPRLRQSVERGMPERSERGMRRIVRTLLLSVMAVLLPGLGVLLAARFLPGVVEGWRAFGFAGWIGLVVMAGVFSCVALVPTHLTSLLAGFLYGVAGGLAAALMVVAIGTVVGFRLAARMTDGEVREFIRRYRWGRVLSREFLERNPVRTGAAIGLARLAPQMPFALGNVLAASAKAPPLPLLVGTLLGMFPRVALVVWVGSELAFWIPGAPLPVGLIFALVAGVVGFGGLALWSWWLLRRKEELPVEPSLETASEAVEED